MSPMSFPAAATLANSAPAPGTGNTGGGIPDYTTCNITGKTGTVYVTASGNGANSNPLPIFIHPKVTSVVLGNPTPAASCSTDPNPSSNCCPISQQATVTASPYVGDRCLSQGETGQLVARAFDENGTNITCQVGHLTFAAQTSAVVTIDENGVATAQQPGSTVISANLTQAGSSAGFFATCPPVSIALNVPNTGGQTNVTVNQNNPQPLSATALDRYGKTLTGLTLDFLSTTPITIPGNSHWNHHSCVSPGGSSNYGSLSAAELQSITKQSDWPLWQRQAHCFKSGKTCHHAGRQQHAALDRKLDTIAVHPAD